MSDKPSFLAELRRRNVLRAGALYIGAAWASSQGVAQLLPVFDFPNWVVRWFVIAALIGFPFAMLFSWYYEWTPKGIVRESEVHPDESVTRETGRKMDRWIYAVMAVAIVLLLADVFVPRQDAQSANTATTSAQSVAVLPLTNESGDKEQQYFSDGLSENLIVALSQFSGLKVIGRNSSFQFRDSKDDSKTIGTKLGVATLLEGSVQHAGDSVRISAELIRAADGSTIWSQSYDRPYKDLFALQDEITRSVAGALKAKLLPTGAAAIQTDRPPSGNLDAYAAYLQGNFYAARNSEADWRKAIEQYAVATRLDPRYALAWAAQSHAQNWLAGEFLGGAEAQQVVTQARKSADTALELEPDLAAAHGARGELLSSFDFDWSGAEAEYRRALQLAPNDSVAMENVGILLGALGQPEQAIAMTRQSLTADPRRVSGYLMFARYQSSLGRFDEAEQTIRKAIVLQPGSGILDAQLAQIEVARGDPKAALDAAQRALPGIWHDYALGMARQIGSDRAAADAALKLMIDQHADGMAFQIAQVEAVRRDPDRTFEWIDRAWANRDPGMQFLLVDPFILRYRDDPRFAAFCLKAGLPTTTAAKALP